MDANRAVHLSLKGRTALIKPLHEQFRKACSRGQKLCDALTVTPKLPITTIGTTTIRWQSRQFVANATIGAVLLYL